MKFALLTATALTVLICGNALAADVEVAPVTDWTGFHIGIGGGGNYLGVNNKTSAEIDDTELNPNPDDFDGVFAYGDQSGDLGKWGGFGTAEIGYDYQIDRMVLGAVAAYDLGSVEVHQSNDAQGGTSHLGPDDPIFSNASAQIESVTKVENSWSVGARLGYLATDSTLIYGIGGYTQAKISESARLDLSADAAATPPKYEGAIGSGGEDWESGFFLGAGIETMLVEHVSLKAEYRYADYGEVDSSFTGTIFSVGGSAKHSADVSMQSVRAVLSYRF